MPARIVNIVTARKFVSIPETTKQSGLRLKLTYFDSVICFLLDFQYLKFKKKWKTNTVKLF